MTRRVIRRARSVERWAPCRSPRRNESDVVMAFDLGRQCGIIAAGNGWHGGTYVDGFKTAINIALKAISGDEEFLEQLQRLLDDE